ncbi:MAG: PadR family transcriptional regulator [Acidobacteriota bacterium]|jgi:DNA-binding PadR family transcriptional regulator
MPAKPDDARPDDPAPADLLPLQPRDYLILLALADGEMHGHGILKVMEEHSGGVLFDPANLYRSLRKLERDGLAAEVQDPPPSDDNRQRRYYALTSLGRDVLAAESTRLARLADAARARDLVADTEKVR